MHIPPRLSAEDNAAANRVNAAEQLQHIDALRENEHFKWFVKTVLEKARDDEQKRALDVGLARKEAERARWRHDALKKVCEEMEAARKRHRSTLKLDQGE